MTTDKLVLSIISFAVGVLAGYLIRCIMARDLNANDNKTLVLLLVSVAWFTSVIVEIINPVYHTNPMIHGLMGSIVGFFYKFELKPKQK